MRAGKYVVAALVVLSACDGGGGGGGGPGPQPRVPTSVAATSATTQTGPAGGLVPAAPAVQVLDQNGQGLAGVTVAFTVTAGGGAVTTPSATTDANGNASASAWSLGPALGANTVTATVASLAPVQFSATAIAGPAAVLSKVSGEPQSGTVGTVLPQPFVVRVADAFGNPVAGRSVNFTVSAGGGTVSMVGTATDAQGHAQTFLTLGTQAGSNTVTANATGLTPVTFTATGQAGPAVSLTKVAGDNQTAPAGTAVPAAPTVRANDAHGNPVPGVNVTFAVVTGGGSISGPAATTGADGRASVGSWTLGGAAGANTLSATAPGVPAVTFTATATTPAVSLTKVAGDNQTAPAGSAVPVAPTVRAVDALGNPIPGVSVTFSVVTGGGSITGPAATTGADGRASVGSWTLGAAGTNTLSATAPGLGAVTFTATATTTGQDPCTTAAPFTPGSTVSGSLVTTDCRLSTGEYLDFYSTTFGAARAEEFRLSSTAFDAFMVLFDGAGQVVAFNDDETTATNNSSIRVFAPAGQYIVAASSFLAGATGAYQLSSRAMPAATDCTVGWVVPGAAVNGALQSGDCAFSDGSLVDVYLVYLRAGQRITVTQRSTAFDSFLLLFNQAGTQIASNDDGAGASDSRIIYTAPQEGVYQIAANSFSAGETGAYSLTVTSP